MSEKPTNPGASRILTEALSDDLLKAARLCHPDWETAGRLTFRAATGEWEAWRNTIFAPAVLPALESAYMAFTQGLRKELARSDAALDSALPPEIAASSRRAGGLLAVNYTVPRAEKLWLHHRDRVAAGEAPGHFAVMFAVRAAAFHLPLGTAVSTLLLLEAHGGAPEAGAGQWTEMISTALPRERAPQLRAA